MPQTNKAFTPLLNVLLDQSIDWVSDTLSVVLVDDTWTFDLADLDLADISGTVRMGSLTSISGTRSVVGSTLVTDDTTTVFSSVAADTEDVGAVLLVGPGATDADRKLLYAWIRRADRTPIVVVTDNGDVVLEFPSGVILSLGG